jgi:hypothetical protein
MQVPQRVDSADPDSQCSDGSGDHSPCITLTSGNVLPRGLSGRVSGTVGLIAAHVLVGSGWWCDVGGANTLSKCAPHRSRQAGSVRDLR